MTRPRLEWTFKNIALEKRGVGSILGGMKTTRRRFVGSMLTCAAGLSMSRSLSYGAAMQTKIPIAIQLYAIRGEFAKDVPGTLKTVAGLGYKAVEFWGYGGTPNVYQKYSARDLRKMLDENGLKCCGIHMDPKALSDQNFKTTLENAEVLDIPYLVVAAAKEKMASEKSISEFAALLNKRAKETGKRRVGYHAHPFDFDKVDGKFAWEILFSQTHPEVAMQMDVANCLTGGGDPVAMLKKFPGRTPSIHLREFHEKTLDSEYYKEVFQLCETIAKTKWYIVEMGGADGNGFEVPREAIAKLHSLGKG